MKIILFNLLLLVSIEVSAQSSWIPLSSGTSNDITNLFFTNDNTGYAVVKGNTQRLIIKTTNGGASWTSVYSQNSDSLAKLQFFNASTGYIKHTGGFLKTTNAGTNWISLPLPSGITAISFINELTGYGLGDLYKFVKTTNGGLNWIQIVSDNYPFYEVHTIRNLFFFNSNTGFASGFINYPEVGTYSVILRTTNGGLNWTGASPNGNCGDPNYYEFGFLDTNKLFYLMPPYQFISTNGGTTWALSSIGSMYSVNFVYGINSSTGFLNSQSGVSSTPGLWKSTNSGVNWFQSSYFPTIPLYSIFFTSETIGYIGGSFGGIYKTTTGGVLTGFTETSSQIPDNFSLSQNYPNPFNPSTIINYQLAINSNVTLKIYDALGNEVQTLVNEKQNAGSYSVDFNAASLPSGIYFYKLVTEKFSETKKMILMK